ncbi:acyl-CoA dehydrogenase [Mycobacterium eburneum]|nr:acyl-CoA dehydrogenase family protein [Mycobacterium eburneum]TDH48359.1 acyl-CoA dehydrogenase [Mycobacterium eburneum]
MHGVLTDEQAQLAEVEKSWLTRHDPLVRVRAALDREALTVDPAAVAHAAESGLLALLTEDMGGSHLELALLSDAHGFAASSLPIADVALACWLLGLAGDERAEDAADGKAVYAATAYLPGATSAMPIPADTGLAGVLVVEDDADGTRLAVFDAPRLARMDTVDLTRSWSRLDSESADHVRRHGLPVGTAALVRDALAVHRALDAVGAAARLLEMTVEYAGQRQQFGVAIGSFQAVKHHCADMALAVEAARATLWSAAGHLDAQLPSEQRLRSAAAATAFAKDAASRVASLALQVHGGIGFTWEHDLHLFLRRIKVDEAMNGGVAHHRAALVR